MLLLLLPAKFRGKINLPDKVVVYVNPLDAVAAGLVGFVDNDLVHKFMQELGSQRCRLGVLLYNFQKTSDIDSLRFGCLYNDAQTFNGLFQFCLLRFIGCGQFGKSFSLMVVPSCLGFSEPVAVALLTICRMLWMLVTLAATRQSRATFGPELSHRQGCARN